jgi:hypothetical protein
MNQPVPHTDAQTTEGLMISGIVSWNQSDVMWCCCRHLA